MIQENKFEPVMSADCEQVESAGVECVILTLSDDTIDRLEESGKLDFFLRLARNLIASSTADDIKKMIMHNARKKVIKLLAALTFDNDI